MTKHEPDETFALLKAMHIPDASPQAAASIIAHARANPRQGWRWLQLLRQLRAFIYLPQSRWVLAVSVVGFFIAVGLIGRMNGTLQPEQTTVAQLPGEDLLLDVDFEFEHEKDRYLLSDITSF